MEKVLEITHEIEILDVLREVHKRQPYRAVPISWIKAAWHEPHPPQIQLRSAPLLAAFSQGAGAGLYAVVAGVSPSTPHLGLLSLLLLAMSLAVGSR
jgi:hypothetical protein